MFYGRNHNRKTIFFNVRNTAIEIMYDIEKRPKPHLDIRNCVLFGLVFDNLFVDTLPMARQWFTTLYEEKGAYYVHMWRNAVIM